jgi:hypothetical protein
MMKTLLLSIAAAALFGAVLSVLPAPEAPTAPTVPFWQLHGAAPAASEAADVAELRLAVRSDPAAALTVAAR